MRRRSVPLLQLKVIFFLVETAIVEKIEVLEIFIQSQIVFVARLAFFGGVASRTFFRLGFGDIELVEIRVPFFFLFYFFPFIYLFIVVVVIVILLILPPFLFLDSTLESDLDAAFDAGFFDAAFGASSSSSRSSSSSSSSNCFLDFEDGFSGVSFGV